MFVSKAIGLFYWSNFQGLYTESILLDLPANIRLDWKGLPQTNTLAYYENSKIRVVKCFVTLAPGVKPIKLFTSVNYECL
jgi:hypothetical protein